MSPAPDPAPSPSGGAPAGTPASVPADATAGVIAARSAAQAAAENFPVALRLLPARYRQHLMAVYRFARTVDDIGDAPLPAAAAGQAGPDRGGQAAERLRLLDELEDDLGRLYRGEPPGSRSSASSPRPWPHAAFPAGRCGI